MSPAGTDKRRDKRLGLALPVKFSREPEGSLSLFNGVTRNVSSGGVYFEAPVGQVSRDDPLWVRIGVPGRREEEKPNLTLVGSGVVRRVEKLTEDGIEGEWSQIHLEQGVCGIAVQFQQRPTIQLQSLEQLLWENGKQ